jgi:hypothetical protein
MSGTQDSIGIKPDHNAQPLPKSDGHAYNRDLSGHRKTTKSATRTRSADTPVNAKSVVKSAKANSIQPID